MTPIIYHDLEQGSDEWHKLRRKNFTASELGEWVTEPLRVNLTVEELKETLTAEGVAFKGNASRATLLSLLPNPDKYLELAPGARSAIFSKITDHKFDRLSSMPFEMLSYENLLWLDRYRELAAKDEKSMEYNIAVKYGRELESEARKWYIRNVNPHLKTVGFVEGAGFGCSPDGVVMYGDLIFSGLEIKCPLPETHLEWLLTGKLPNEHRIQVHACMAITGAETWDFLSYCPGDPPLLITVHRDDTTDRIAEGLQTTVREMRKIQNRLKQLTNEHK